MLTEQVAAQSIFHPLYDKGNGFMGTDEGFIMPNAGDDDIVFHYLGDVGGLIERIFQLLQAFTLLGAKRQITFRTHLVAEVNLVAHHEQTLPLALPAHVPRLLVRGVFICHPHHNRGLVELLVGALYAESLYLVVGMPDARGVYEAEGQAMYLRGVFYDIARSAMHIADDGFLLVEQLVEQRALAHVGLSHDSHGNALLYGLSRGKGAGEPRDAPVYLCRQGQKLSPIGKLQFLVVAEVQLQLHEGGDMQQLFPQCGKFVREMATQLAQGHLVGSLVGGGYQVGNGLGLAQVHLPVKVSPFGILARLRLSAPALYQRTEDAGDDILAAMARDFHAVFSRIGMGSLEDAGHHFVDGVALAVG